jgi:hypothetical protein
MCNHEVRIIGGADVPCQRVSSHMHRVGMEGVAETRMHPVGMEGVAGTAYAPGWGTGSHGTGVCTGCMTDYTMCAMSRHFAPGASAGRPGGV